MLKLLYKPLGMLFGVLGGLLANAIFHRVWRRIGGTDEAPKATSPNNQWQDVLLGAAIQGVVFAVVKAAVDRAGATGFQRLTGTWPGG